MKTQKVTFTGYHTSFAHEVGESAELSEIEAKRAIDLGIATAYTGKEKATAQAGQTPGLEPVTDKASLAATEARAKAHGDGVEAVVASVDEIGTVGILPVGTEPDGTKVLGKPADNALNQTSAPGEKVVSKK